MSVRLIVGCMRTAGQTAENPVGDEENVPIEVVLPRLLSHLNTAADPRLPKVAAILRGWNQQRVDNDADGRYDNPAVAIDNRWYADFVSHAFAREFGTPDSSSPLDNTTFANLAVRLLEGRPATRTGRPARPAHRLRCAGYRAS